MVDREVDGPVWVVLGRSWGLCVRSWVALGAGVGGLWAYVGDLGPLLGLCGRSWAALGASTGGLGCTWAALGPILAILARSWASTGGPGPLFGPLCAVLGRSWGLFWRSGAEKCEEHGCLEKCLFL